MLKRSLFAALAVACLVGCRGETGAKITGVIVENGAPLPVGPKDVVLLGMVPVKVDENSIKANPGADFKRDDSSFVFIGPGLGLVPRGEYKITLLIRPREGADRFGGLFSKETTPLTYSVTDEPRQEIIIDVGQKTVTRK